NRADWQEALAACRTLLVADCSGDDLDAAALDAAAPLPAGATDDETALAQRPHIRALRFGRDSPASPAVLALRRAIPPPQISLSYQHDNNAANSGNQFDALVLGVSIPLPIFDSGRHDAARARAQARELEAQAEAATHDARSDVQALAARKRELEQSIARLDQ